MAIEAGSGPSGLPRLGAIQSSVDAGSGAQLRTGVVVSVRVLADLGQGLWRLRAGDSELVARSERNLAPGMSFRAKVEAGATAIVLHPLVNDGSRQATLLAKLGLPDDSASRLALMASLVEGMRPEAARLGRIRRALRGGEGGEGEERDRAAMAARLEAKGLASGPEAVDLLESLAGGDGGDSRGGGDENHGRDRKYPLGLSEKEGDRPRPDSIGSNEGGGGKSAEPVDIAVLLTSLVRAHAAPASDEVAAFLGLFNHLGKKGGVLLPFSLCIGSIAFKGSLLLHLPYFSGLPVFVEGRFSTHRQASNEGSASSWYFVYESQGRGKSRIRLELPEWHDRALIDQLAETLRESACELVVGPIDRGVEGLEEVLVDA
ncbi:MAG TPA: hypothetical protein VMV44_11220 [Rectinemataceae bacterium]|nr:hypothetical protein [Rectinemataceae bacterium]